MPAPRPGSPVRGSRSGEPIMALLDLLGRRWALRVIWELRDPERRTFRELRTRCGDMSASVLAERLRELGEAGVLDSSERDGGYGLTAEGRLLLEAYPPLHAWAERWAARTAS